VSVWQRLIEFIGSASERTGVIGSLANLLDPDKWLPGGRDAAFSFALVALSAKMAVADGVVSLTEVKAFERTVHIAPEEAEHVERLFGLAQQDVAGFEHYARKVARFFAESPEMLEHVLDGLFHIAAADGFVHEAELAYLHDVNRIFGFDEARFEEIAAQHVVLDGGADPYTVLGLTHDADAEEIRRVYRRLAAENHPDRLLAKGVPPELIDVATARMQAINEAYRQLTRRRTALAAPDPA